MPVTHLRGKIKQTAGNMNMIYTKGGSTTTYKYKVNFIRFLKKLGKKGNYLINFL